MDEYWVAIKKYMRSHMWYVFFFLCVFFFFSYYLALLAAKNDIPCVATSHDSLLFRTHNTLVGDKNENYMVEQVLDQSCIGRYIYVHDLPSRFNADILTSCSSLFKWHNMCEFISNYGLGPEVKTSGKKFQKKSWYATEQTFLEIIFHNRMKNYKCVTNNSSLASAIFVPFYAGLDVGRYLWDGSNTSVRDSNALELVKWLVEKPEWRRMDGRDHFLVTGRVTWDFRRQSDENSLWGNKLLTLPETMNMTILGIESQRSSLNEFAIPYPSYFHPWNDGEIFHWQEKMRIFERPLLYSFVGGPRPKMSDSIRGDIISQCLSSKRKTKLLDCNTIDCHDPVNVMNMFRMSKFCLQPSGDSFTRRSTFDSILAGCIPVFFHRDSAYTQYIWHLPEDYRKYSVFIAEEEIRNGTKIEKILQGLSRDEVMDMREEVIKLIPAVIYAHPWSRLESVEDAFDIAVQRVVERVGKIRKEMEQRSNSSSVDLFEERK